MPALPGSQQDVAKALNFLLEAGGRPLDVGVAAFDDEATGQPPPFRWLDRAPGSRADPLLARLFSRPP